MLKQIIIFIFLLSTQYSIGQNDYLLAENYYRQGEYEKATQLFKNLYKKSPYNTSYLQRLIACYQETNKFSSAESLLKNRLQKTPTLTYLNVILGYNYARQNQREIAKKYYETALKSIEKNASYGGIIGRIFKDYNLLDEAIAAYEKSMQKNPKSNYHFMIAQIYGEKGEFEKMFQSYIDLVDKNENYLNTVQRYASKYITDDAENKSNILFKKTLLKKSISNPKNVWNGLLSWLFAQQHDYKKALTQEKALFARNGELSNIVDLGQVAFDNKDFDASDQCFSFILEKSSIPEEKLNAHLYLIKAAVVQKRPETETMFTEIFSKYGKNSLTLPVQVEYANYLTFQKNKPEQAKTVLEKAEKYARNKFQKARIKLQLGEVLVFTGKFNKALIYFSQVQTQLKNHYLAQEARFKVAQTSYFKGDFDWAKAQLKVLKGSTTQLIANDAVDLFLTISDNQPQDSIPTGLKKLAKADLLAFQNKDGEALAVLDAIFADFSGQPIEYEALFKKGKILLKQEKYEDAILTFAKVIANDPEGIYNDDVFYEMAELHNKLNKPEKAKEYYQKIIFDHPSSIYLVDARKKYRKLRGDDI